MSPKTYALETYYFIGLKQAQKTARYYPISHIKKALRNNQRILAVSTSPNMSALLEGRIKGFMDILF